MNPQNYSVLHPSWVEALHHELLQPYLKELWHFVIQERAGSTPIYPPSDHVFNAFNQTPYEQVKVVIVGQDPYHGPGQAHGLCFSVPPEIPFPPSLRNIFKELQQDLSVPKPKHGCLDSWAEQGVLLLNATLTVRDGQPLSHHGKGWERFTDAVIGKLCEREDPIIFVLWGKNAQDKCRFIEGKSSNHIILKAPHPSPLSASRGFLGCRHFSQINALLAKLGKSLIKWEL